MGSLVEIGGIAGWSLIAGPLVVLLAAVVLALFWPYRQAAPQAVLADRVVRTHESVETFERRSGETDREADRKEISAVPAVTGLATGASEGKGIDPPYNEAMINSGDVASFEAPADVRERGSYSDADTALAPRPQTEPETGQQTGPESGIVHEADRDAAEARQFLEAAAYARESGDDHTAADNLRDAIRLTVRSGHRELHARARLELGDIAQAEGDLQTACEHWQLARSLFEDEKNKANAGACEQRMSRNGCPTDWVLTDF